MMVKFVTLVRTNVASDIDEKKKNKQQQKVRKIDEEEKNHIVNLIMNILQNKNVDRHSENYRCPHPLSLSPLTLLQMRGSKKHATTTTDGTHNDDTKKNK